jgi:hypothetical protein
MKFLRSALLSTLALASMGGAFSGELTHRLSSQSSFIDADGNGVRDDVDALIRSKYTNPIHSRAATQYARAIQMAVSAASSPSPATIQEVFTAVIDAVDCSTAQLGEVGASAMIGNVRAATLNTKERLAAYRKTDSLFSGHSATITDADPKGLCR